MFIGLVLGSAIAAAAAWYFTQVNPFHETPDAPRIAAGSAPAALPGKPGAPPVVKFDFYNVLPGGENAPASQAQPQPPQSLPQLQPISPPQAPAAEGKIFLQIGSYGNLNEADGLKARLALMGMEASLQRVQLTDGRVVHRVRVGPFSGPEEMVPVRDRLSAAGFTTTINRNP
ncbi:MAG: SPOR domain-containing protein [Azoarcus sp.]|nr:SPOR domain-containing protein [Azoarcus sp.]